MKTLIEAEHRLVAWDRFLSASDEFIRRQARRENSQRPLLIVSQGGRETIVYTDGSLAAFSDCPID